MPCPGSRLQVRTIDVHPSGQFLVAGTNHSVLRLYDVNTAQCFASQNPFDHHTVRQLRQILFTVHAWSSIYMLGTPLLPSSISPPHAV